MFLFLFCPQKGLQPLECAELGGHKDVTKLLQSAQVLKLAFTNTHVSHVLRPAHTLVVKLPMLV